MNQFGLMILGICIIVAAIILRLPAQRTGRYQAVATSGVNVLVLDTQTGLV